MGWSGLEWPVVDWSGLEWPGVGWSGLEWIGVAWSGLEWVGAQFDKARLECKYDYAMKRKNQNKCYHARAVTLIIVFRNIYQIFCPITHLKQMLITNQYVQQIIV